MNSLHCITPYPASFNCCENNKSICLWWLTIIFYLLVMMLDITEFRLSGIAELVIPIPEF